MKFEVGEVVIYWCPEAPSYHRRECTITGPLAMRMVCPPYSGYAVPTEVYPISFGEPDEILLPPCAPPENLRKRPQPPDWQKLASPAEVPEDAIA